MFRLYSKSQTHLINLYYAEMRVLPGLQQSLRGLYRLFSIMRYIGCLIAFFALVTFQANAQDSSFVKKTYKKFYNNYLKNDFSPSNPDSARGFKVGVKRVYNRLYKKYVYVDSTQIDRDSSKGFSSNPVAVPVISYSQEQRVGIGLALIYSFYRNRFDVKALRTSLYVNAGFFHLYEIRYRFKPLIWGENREYRFQQTVDFQDYPTNFYGIGNHTLESNLTRVRYIQVSASGEIQKRISKKLYIGINAAVQYVHIKDITRPGYFDSLTMIDSRTGGRLFQLGPTMNFDTRNFQNYADKGDYIRAAMLYSPSFLNESLGSLVSYTIDARHYAHLDNSQVLALNLVATGFLDKYVPFSFLSQLGGNQIMRGYYVGRFRDKNMAAVQAEYRYRFIPRVAAAVFTGTGLVYGYEPFRFGNLKPDFGGGVRYIFDLPSRSTLRIDYAVGEKPSGERRLQGLYISINEAF